MIDLSIVVPLRDEEANLRELVERLVRVLESTGERFEIVLVDDGSRDGTFAMASAMSSAESRLQVIRLARSFGQEAAVQAGMLATNGQWVIQLDGDLQHPPEEIPKLLARRGGGHEIVYGLRRDRQDPAHRIALSRALVFSMRRLLGIPLPDDISTFRLFEGELARFIARLPERHKFTSALAGWTGARSTSVPVEHASRRAGHSKYGALKLLVHTFDLVVGFTIRPLRMIGTTGLVFAASGIAFALFKVGQRLAGVPINVGWTSQFSAIVILGGLQLIALSVIGEYVGRIFVEVQGRPAYRIAEHVGRRRDGEEPGGQERGSPVDQDATPGSGRRLAEGG